jgi:hypothetical protein
MVEHDNLRYTKIALNNATWTSRANRGYSVIT